MILNSSHSNNQTTMLNPIVQHQPQSQHNNHLMQPQSQTQQPPPSQQQQQQHPLLQLQDIQTPLATYVKQQLQQPHILFNLSPIDVRDEYDDRTTKCYHSVQAMIAKKSEKECNDILVAAINKNQHAYEDITIGLLVSLLKESDGARYYRDIVHINKDGLGLLISQLNYIIVEKTNKLKEHSIKQILWTINQLMKSNVAQTDSVCHFILRQIVGGDVSPKNIWLTESVLDLLIENRPWLVNNANSFMISTVIYTYLRVVADHTYSTSTIGNQFAALRQKEIDFLIGLIREKFSDCITIGRDFVRLLQNVSYKIPEFDSLWNDIVKNPKSLAASFQGLHQLLAIRTPRRLFQSRLTQEMEKKILFLASHVKFGQQKRYQDWFQKQYLSTPESQSLRCDLIRYICAVIHPTNEVLCSEILPRWAIIGWLLTTCTSQVASHNAKLSIFYDWLSFDSERDNIMNIEPAILLLHHSMRSHPAITASLLEFLCRLPQNFQTNYLIDKVKQGIKNSLSKIQEKRVLPSLSPLFDNPKFDSALKNLLRETFPEFCSSSQSTDAPSTIKSGNAACGNTNISNASSQDTNSNDTANDKNALTIPPFTGPNHSPDETSPMKKPTYSNSQPPNKPALRVPPSESCPGVDSESSIPNIDTGVDTLNPKRPLPATKKCDSDSEIRPKQEPPIKKHKSKHPPESANDTNNSVLNVASDVNSKQSESVSSPEEIINHHNTTSTCSNNNTSAKENTPKTHQDQVAGRKETKVIYPFMSIASHINFEPARVMTQFEKPVRQLFESLLKESDNEVRCDIMDKLITTFSNEEIFDSGLIAEFAMTIAYAVQNDFSCRVFPSSQSAESLEESIGSPIFVLMRTILTCREDKPTQYELLALLVEISNSIKGIGFLLIYFLKVSMPTDKSDLVSTYKAFCKSAKKDISRSLQDDMEMAHQFDVAMFCFIVPAIYEHFSSSVLGNAHLLHIVVSCVDSFELQQLICLVVQRSLVMIDEESLSDLLSISLDWETWEQYCLWQLMIAHDVSIDTVLPVISKLDHRSHSEALTCSLLMLKRETPNLTILKQVMHREFKKEDLFTVSLLTSWSEKKEAKRELAKLIGELLDSKSNNPSVRRKGQKNNSAKPNQSNISNRTETILSHLDLFRQHSSNNLLSQESIRTSLHQVQLLCNDIQKNKFGDLFALAEEAPDFQSGKRSKELTQSKSKRLKKHLDDPI